jgi:hypothetical protein
LYILFYSSLIPVLPVAGRTLNLFVVGIFVHQVLSISRLTLALAVDARQAAEKLVELQ